MPRALVFPGQGAQYVGMGFELAQEFPAARDVLDQADEALGFALSDVITNGPEDELKRTDISQPAILTVSWMAYRVLERMVAQRGFVATAGLSLGEYTALLAAGSLEFADAVRLVRLRGEAMQAASEAEPSGMVVLVGAEEGLAAELCTAVAEGQVLQVANLNSPGQVVISGAQAACDRAIAMAKERGIRRAMPLPVAGAFHSALMAPAAERLAAALEEVAIGDPQVPVYANVSAEPVRDAATARRLLIEQLTAPVRWADSVRRMHADGIDTFWELGPGKTLCGMISRTVKDVQVANIDQPQDALRLAKAQAEEADP